MGALGVFAAAFRAAGLPPPDFDEAPEDEGGGLAAGAAGAALHARTS